MMVASAQVQRGVKTRTVSIPTWLKWGFLLFLLAMSITGLLVVDEYVDQSSIKNIAYGVFFVLGAVALGLMLLRLDELRQLRRWNTWNCPHCSTQYRLREFSEVRFWGTEKTKTRAGVLLTCQQCGDETAFDEAGKIHHKQ